MAGYLGMEKVNLLDAKVQNFEIYNKIISIDNGDFEAYRFDDEQDMQSTVENVYANNLERIADAEGIFYEDAIQSIKDMTFEQYENAKQALEESAKANY